MLRIQDIAFEVDGQRSEFFAYIPQEPPGKQSPGRLCWSLQIYCMDKEDARGFGTPYLETNDMTFDSRDWRMIEGQTARNEGGAGLTAYLHTPEPRKTSGNSIFFVSRRDNLFTVEWECSADVCWDVEHSSGLPLRLDIEMAFNGVHIWWVKADAKGLTEVKELVGRHFDLASLEEPQIAGPHHIVFPPRFKITT